MRLLKTEISRIQEERGYWGKINRLIMSNQDQLGGRGVQRAF